MIASFSFASTARVNQWSTLTRRSNLTPQRAKNTVNDLSLVSVVLKSKASWLHSFLSFFFPEASKLQSAVYSQGK